jgi:hypothetical protein
LRLHEIEQALAVTRRSVVAIEIIDGLAEVAGALIAGSASDQWARAADSSDGVSGSWEIACNLLMQHVRLFP